MYASLKCSWHNLCHAWRSKLGYKGNFIVTQTKVKQLVNVWFWLHEIDYYASISMLHR